MITYRDFVTDDQGYVTKPAVEHVLKANNLPPDDKLVADIMSLCRAVTLEQALTPQTEV